MELEYKYDMHIDEYFSLPEEAKSDLTNIIIQYYLPVLRNSEQALMNLMFAYQIKLEEAEKRDEYEEADICKRVLNVLEEINRINLDDWKQESQ